MKNYGFIKVVLMLTILIGTLPNWLISVKAEEAEILDIEEISSEDYDSFFGNERELMSMEEFKELYETETSPLSRSTLVRVRRLTGIDGGRFISIMSLDGAIVFCLDPTVTAGLGDEYTMSYDWYSLPWTTQYRIWQVVRFGYQTYGTDAYYIASQILIWRALGFWMTPDWNVDAEISQIESNIVNYGTSPSFAFGTYDVEFNVPITLHDTNNVLNGYNVTCGGGIICSKSGNDLTITVNNINYQRGNSVSISNNGNNDPSWVGIVFVRPGSQSVASIYTADPVAGWNFGLRMLTGNLLVHKLDEYGLPADAGQSFEIAWDRAFTNIIGTFTSTAGLLEVNDLLPAGTYYIREVAATTPYTVNPIVYDFEIVLNETTEITIYNDLKEVELLRTKNDVEETTLLLNGAVFDVFDVTETSQIQATDPDTGDLRWEDEAGTIPLMVWDNPVYQYTVVTGNQYVRLYDPTDHSQPLTNKEVVFSYVNTFDQDLYPLVTNTEGMINLTENSIIAIQEPVLDPITGDPVLDPITGDPTYTTIQSIVYYQYVIVEDDPGTPVDETELSDVIQVNLRTEEELLGWANLPLKHSRVYYVLETDPPIGYEIEGNAGQVISMDLADGIKFREDVVSNRLRRLTVKTIKVDANNNAQLLNGATFKYYDLYYATPTNPDGEYLGEYITGALLIQETISVQIPILDPITGDPVLDPITGDPTFDTVLDPVEGVVYHVYDSNLFINQNVVLSDLTAETPTFIFTTNQHGEILEYLPDGKYFVLNTDTDVITIFYSLKGTISLSDVRYGHPIKACEIASPGGYQMPQDSCQIFYPTANVGVEIFEHLRENKRIVIPNTGDYEEHFNEMTRERKMRFLHPRGIQNLMGVNYE